MRRGTGRSIGRAVRGWTSVATVAMLSFGGCDGTTPQASAAAVDHVASVLADAGRAPAQLEGAVRLDCGPTDEFLGIHLDPDPVHVEVAWADVAPVVADLGDDLPDPPEDPQAGAPTHVDHHETSGDGWRVRWGESQTVQAPDGAPATTITFVDGGEVDGNDLTRWEQDGTVPDLYGCG